MLSRPVILATLALAAAAALRAQAPAPSSGQRYGRLLIKNAMVIDGAGNPTRGPMDILIEGSTVANVQESKVTESSAIAPSQRITGKFDRVIDAARMYVIPGIIDVHSHIQFSRAGKAMPK